MITTPNVILFFVSRVQAAKNKVTGYDVLVMHIVRAVRGFSVVRHAFYLFRYILTISTSQKNTMQKSDTTIIGKFSYRVTWEAIERGEFRTWGRRGLRGVSGLDTIVIQGHAARRLSGYYSLTSHGNTHPRWLTHPRTCDTAHHGELSPSFGNPTYWLGDLT